MSQAAAPPGAATPAPPPAQAASAASAEPSADEREKQLLSRGYRPQMHNGKKVFCKREAILGSRTDVVMHCGTVDELARVTQFSREATEQGQRNRSWFSSH